MELHFVCAVALLLAAQAPAQSLLKSHRPGRPAPLLPHDAAVLASPEQRRDLPCSVKPVNPELGMDLAFHAGYEVRLPLRELAGTGDTLTAVFRVVPRTGAGSPTYFFQKWTVPPIEEGAPGTAELRGEFLVGEGRYQVEWLVRDRAERVCATRWQFSAEPHDKDRMIELRLPRGAVEPEAFDPFASEVTGRPQYGGRTLRLQVLMHVAPQDQGAASLRSAEIAALVAILRHMVRDERIGSLSIAAFNLEYNQLLYRSDDDPNLDFPALGRGIAQLRLGTVSAQALAEKDSRAEFLGSLVADALETNRPDALIFLGAKTRGDSPMVSRALSGFGVPGCPVFYLNYDMHPISNPWQDLIGSVVKGWKGTEYTITRPRDLSIAWTDIMSRLSRNTELAIGR